MTVPVIVMVLVVAAMGGRWLLLRRALRRRAPICQLLPADTFDPSPEEVARFAAVLSRVRRVSRTVGGRQASAVRIRLASVDGALAFTVEGPQGAASLVRASGYAGVEVRPVPAREGEA
jgi:hypothetical protein